MGCVPFRGNSASWRNRLTGTSVISTKENADNLMHQVLYGGNDRKSSRRKSPAGLGGTASWMWDSPVPFWPGRMVVSWAVLGSVLARVEGGDLFALITTGEATAGVLGPVLGS